jgi:hypothetical protein
VNPCQPKNHIGVECLLKKVKMLYLVNKTTRLNLRVTEEFRDEIQALADYNGITLSSMAHSLLVKAVRNAKTETPEAFGGAPVDRLEPTKGVKVVNVPVIGETADETQKPRRKKAG